jgi:hypothetical protein
MLNLLVTKHHLVFGAQTMITVSESLFTNPSVRKDLPFPALAGDKGYTDEPPLPCDPK